MKPTTVLCCFSSLLLFGFGSSQSADQFLRVMSNNLMLFVFTGRSEQDSGLKQLYALSVKTPASGNLLLRGRTPVRPRSPEELGGRVQMPLRSHMATFKGCV
ncbi:hypothetical protein FQA47_000958 [Oryzias melastigma]|uniref:Uncharacterized protein n=1 Tax=Oryzias melastigma TaxID=30732 RepID=A0A834EZH0_ORYME|nr:hypothetical protein FQA47_000958 [Oryzias melastigma]